jgi:hypothetical protein
MRVKHTMTPEEEQEWVAEQQRLILERERWSDPLAELVQTGYAEQLPSVVSSHGWPPEPD